MESVELPYKAEYAKSGRAGCKGCKTNIPQGALRIAVMVQSPFHDSKQANWFHEVCFFKKQRPSSVGDIDNFENLRFDDQQRVEKQVAEVASIAAASGGGKKRTKGESNALKDFGIEYSKSGRATCCGCQLKILKNEVRIRKTVFDTEIGMKYGGQPLWHHVECFAQMRSELAWFEKAESLPGFNSLKAEDKEIVLKALPAIKTEDAGPSAKKLKNEKKTDEEETHDKELAAKIKDQTKQLYFFRDNIKDSMTKPTMIHILQHNSQDPVVGDSEKLLDQVADLLTFGAIAACTECKGRQLLFQKSGYLCNGQLTEWTKCANIVKEPIRSACKIPSDLKKEYRFLSKVSKKPLTRLIRYIPPSLTTIAKSIKKNEDELDGPKVIRAKPPLYNFSLSYIYLPKKDSEQIKRRILQLGGKCDSKITNMTVAIFGTAKDIEGTSSRIIKAKELGIQIIPFEYLDSVEADPQNALNLIRSMSLCDWGTDPAARIPEDVQKSGKSKSIYTKSVPKSVTLKIKDGMAVDPDSGLSDVADVYMKGKDKYSVVLGLTDVQRNKNSYYKIQLLVSPNKKKFWVFRSWGRIGTTIGDNKLESFDTLNHAMSVFTSVYYDKTGNHFDNRDHFEKMPGRMYPIDIQYDDNDGPKLDEKSNIKSKLKPAVQELIRLLFDVETMKQTMKLFDLDMDKMPLGKLTQKQIISSYKVLTELSVLCQDENSSNSKFIDATNRFYTLIPHNFGVSAPPLINTKEQIEKLREMLDSLMEIEYAYSLLNTEVIDTDDVNPLDRHYDQLKTKLEPLDKQSEEFKLMQKYVTNTHAETHKMYDLEIEDIFKVERQGESRRFKPFKKLHNRKLLWHGSRLTNFAGILSHGLKIAPPEAPVTGYMFGKGIYFADMVSKSANYCCTSNLNSTGLLLLSEVALGDMMECTAAKMIRQLPTDKHSCFGHGRTMPDPKKSHFMPDGVEIPLGSAITDDKLKSSLLYNEYIVYDIAQVNIKYMLRLNFKYKF